MITFKIKIEKKKEKEISGMLLSFFTCIEEIVRKKRKASYIVHFWQERLTKSERKDLLNVILQFQEILVQSQERQLQEDSNLKSINEIPKEFQIVLRTFSLWGGVSKPARVSHQEPKAGSTSPS